MGIASIMLIFILAAFVVIFIGILLLVLSSTEGDRGRIEGGGIVIIGPLPIVIGTSERVSKVLLILAVTLTLVTLLVFFLMSRAILNITSR